MLPAILSILSAIITIYTIFCFINVLLSWIPGLKFTAFGKFLSKICDPYMNLFSRWGILRFGHLDFSPIVSIGFLTLISTILAGIQGTGRIYFGGILATIIYMIWSVVSPLLIIFMLLLLIRWIVLLVNKGKTSFDSAWNQIDLLLNKITYRIAKTFTKSGISYQKSLLISWISFAVVFIAGEKLIDILIDFCKKIPF